MRKTKKTQWLPLSLLFLLFLGVLSGCTNVNDDRVQSNEKEEVIVEESKSENIQAELSESEKEVVAEDEIVNDFILAYNEISENPFINVKKGNIRTKYHAESSGYWFELLNSNSTGAISISISQTNDTADAGVSGMKQVFNDVVKAIDSTLTDDEINTFFDNLVSGKQVGELELGNTFVSFSPDIEGRSRGHIEIDAKGEKVE